MSRTPKHTCWEVDGAYYGRVKSFATPQAFLERIYNACPQDWQADHPIAEFVAAASARVTRQWYRYNFLGGRELYLDGAPSGERGAFELWELPTECRDPRGSQGAAEGEAMTESRQRGRACDGR